jgi:hypothetical protein
MAPIDLFGLRYGKSRRKKIWENGKSRRRRWCRKYKKEKKEEAERAEVVKKCLAYFYKEMELMEKEMAEYPGGREKYIADLPPLSEADFADLPVTLCEADFELLNGQVHH